MSENNYLALLSDLLHAPERPDRTGVGTRSLFGRELRFDLTRGFPLLTTKRVFWRGVVEELAWFLRGEYRVRSLQHKGIKIWDAWADPWNGAGGPLYGAQWRGWWEERYDIEHDQIRDLVNRLRDDPFSRRHIVSAWNVADLRFMALAPCHFAFQCYVTGDRRLSMKVTQRSADIFLGVPFNIASYALLTHILAHEAGLEGVGELILSFGDVHLYTSHLDAALTQLSREPLPLPVLLDLPKGYGVDEFAHDTQPALDALTGYRPAPTIKAEVAV